MSRPVDTAERPAGSPLLAPGHTYASVEDAISTPVLRAGAPRWWVAGFAATFLLVIVLLYAVTVLFARGVGVWGVNVPVAWGFAIVNFVWWIGIGHAGTLISAILLLLNQQWRTSINRFAEAMTLFAVACAALFPLLHLGRPDRFYWMLPYPNTMDLQPQFRSPLVWDLFAVLTYGIVSLLFWYVGLIPDLASLRDRARHRWARMLCGIFALGWRGAARHWDRYEMAYLLLAGLATPLVVSVHSIVCLDFAVSLVPGWHTTVFPPYFVAGAIYSGFAMVIVLVIPLRTLYGFGDFITTRHLDVMAKVMLATGLFVAYGYAAEVFYAWYGGGIYEMAQQRTRAFGPYAPAYWALLAANVAIPQLLWFRRVRTSVPALFAVAFVINIGMWLERFVIVIVSLHRDFLVSSWAMYYPTGYDWATLLGTIGLFLALLFLFVRLLPVISMHEMRALLAGEGAEPMEESGG